MWGCGLKPRVTRSSTASISVTPHVGVWIETKLNKEEFYQPEVTPHVGVWIETKQTPQKHLHSGVTPHVGVWIETGVCLKLHRLWCCHPPCGGVD